ncbi:MAG: hypothetical protein PHF17_10625 [Arcobacteraceae bacterium]|jgi:hypothetical protein|nr:hypothetical protein [Arcobacteraceae bacterium]
MSMVQNLIKLDGEFSILFHLPKKCNCDTCMSTKNSIKAKMGEKKYRQICSILKIH